MRPGDLTEVCLHLAANMLYLAGKGSLVECMALAQAAVESGCALAKQGHGASSGRRHPRN